jgi:hypothetical protein
VFHQPVIGLIEPELAGNFIETLARQTPVHFGSGTEKVPKVGLNGG